MRYREDMIDEWDLYREQSKVDIPTDYDKLMWSAIEDDSKKRLRRRRSIFMRIAAITIITLIPSIVVLNRDTNIDSVEVEAIVDNLRDRVILEFCEEERSVEFEESVIYKDSSIEITIN